MLHENYRRKYLNAPTLKLDKPVDISLELSSFCSMHCTYCLDPNALVLTSQLIPVKIKELKEGDELAGFDEYGKRLFRNSIVEKVWSTFKPAILIETDNRRIICSYDHKFLMNDDSWFPASLISLGDSISCLNENDYKDGSLVIHHYEKVNSIMRMPERELIDIQTSTKTFYANGFATHNCYHADKKNLPFKQAYMLPETFKKIINDAANLGVHSVKTNWRGESTMNPWFPAMTLRLKEIAEERKDGTFIDRITNSNFKFINKVPDIMKGLCAQTKVKVSYDSFRKEVFEKQRAGGNHDVTTTNIDLFYNWPGRDNILVIQAVRTSLNKDEDIEHEAKKRWPDAIISIRDMVEGRVNKDLDTLKHKERDYSERQSCIQAHARLIFDTQGVATACCPDIRQELKLGDINKMTITEIWNSPEAIKLREDLLSLKAFENSPCKNCSSFETFKGYQPSYES